MYFYGNKADSVFDLLGSDENSLTCSLAWSLLKSKSFLKKFVGNFYREYYSFKNNEIHVQRYGEGDKGYTDLEVSIDKDLFFIVENKIGWNLPSKRQLKRYLPRFRNRVAKRKFILVISECSEDYAKRQLPDRIYGIDVHFICWNDLFPVINEAKKTASSSKEKLVLNELKTYFNRVIRVGDIKSNMVFIVALSNKKLGRWCGLSGVDIVKRGIYFYPAIKGWPQEPPNYIAFRYQGKLQTIHHVDNSKLVERLHTAVPEVSKRVSGPYFVLTLGEAIEPRREIPNGNIWSNAHLRCMLDLLFTSKTISDAAKETRRRLEEIE